jgi:NDP-sugar pyrophosphorylase family protein
MKAMILAAGFGTRLKPLTKYCPKALVPVGNRPVLDRNIEYLRSAGVSEVIINAHYLAGHILKHVGDGRRFGLHVEVRVEQDILGTGGGIRNVSDFWDEEPFIVINGDVLTDIDLEAIYKAHLSSKVLVTMVLHTREPFNQISVDCRGKIQDIAEKNLPGRFAFTGIHIISPAFLAYLPHDVHFLNIVDAYRMLIASGKTVHGYISCGHQWHDIGTVPSYLAANHDVSGKSPFLLGSGSRLHKRAVLSDWAVVGKQCYLQDGALVKRSVLWDQVTVHKGVRVIDSVVSSCKEVKQDIIQGVL